MTDKLYRYFKDIGDGHFRFNYRHCPYVWILDHLHHSDANGYYYCCRKEVNRPLEYCEVFSAANELGLRYSYNLLYRNIAHPDFNPEYKNNSDKPKEGFYFYTPKDYGNEEECQQYESIWNKLEEEAYKELKPILDLWVANHNNVMRFPITTCDVEELLKRYADEQK